VPRQSLEALDHPRGAIPLLVEALVLSFDHDATARRFTLVADYPQKAPGADRSFVALCFAGVRDFVRERGSLPALQRFTENYATSDGPPVVVQSFRTTTTRFELWLGPSFGGLSFHYADLAAFLRHSRAREVDGEWVYRDLDSDELLDSQHPFAGQDLDAMRDDR
jgi:hypothetical protein